MILAVKAALVWSALAGVFLWGWKSFFDEFGPT